MDMMMILEEVVHKNASDLHITAGVPPVFRIHGKLIPSEYDVLSSDDTKRMIYGVMTDQQKEKFETELELDFSISIAGLSRFRVNVHLQRNSVSAAFRVVPAQAKTIEQLGLPHIVAELVRKPNGLVLITGPAGQGKSTTMAAMIDQINREKRSLIISIEDPIEYMHKHKKSIIRQREVFSDTLSFANALRHALRQDPDVIAVGEMRDLETIATALTAAETGHLIISTLHTPDVPQTIDRIIDIFPPAQQQQIKIQLSDCVQGIISQSLLPRSDGKGRVVACEILVATPAIRNLIRQHKTEQILNMIQTGSEYGMVTFEKSLKSLVARGSVDYILAKAKARYPEEFESP